MKNHKPQPRAIKTLRHYLRISLRYKWVFGLNILMPTLGVATGDIAFRYYLGILFEQLSTFQTIPVEAIWRTFYIMLALILAQVVFWRINDYTFLRRQAKTLRDMEQYVFNQMQKHSYRFFSENFSGSLSTQFNRFLKSYETLEDIFEFELLTAAITLVFSIVVLLFIAPVLGIALLIWAILFISLITWLTIKKSPLTRTAAMADSRVTANVADVITNIITVKTFARGRHETKRFTRTSQDRFAKRWKSWLFDAHIRNVRWVFVVVFLFIYLYLSIKLVTTGQTSVATVLTAQLYIMLIYNQLFNLNRTIQQIELAFSDANEMTDILDLAPEVKEPKFPEPVRIEKGFISFRKVDFRYDSVSNEVLHNFSLDIQPGQKIGLVGHSGSGKSTLTRLLLRFADLQAGKITIDDQDISRLAQDDLRAHIAFVPQEPILFHSSLMENIRYGREDASDEEVHEAARLAHAAEFINALPNQYETLVGERGIKLSGGEKQRVAIARAMLSRAPILILDEATSALDSKSEKFINIALDELMKQRTTIVVAHRLSTIQRMDRIIVLEEGSIIEEGSHKDLLGKGGTYAEFWTHQSGGFLED